MERSERKSGIAGLPRVGGLATMPTRLAGLRLVLGDIVDQLDRLYLFLDGFDSVPDFVVSPKIVLLRSEIEGRWYSSGKFLGLTREGLDCVYLTFDDDIRYPSGYVERLVAALERVSGKAMVGYHGTFFLPPHESFRRNRLIASFFNALSVDMAIDSLGTATAAFLPARFPIEPGAWPYRDIDDLMVAFAAERHGVPRIALARPAGYLRPIALMQADSLSLLVKKDDSRQTHYMRMIVALQQRSPGGPPPLPVVRRRPPDAGAPTAPRRPFPPASRSP